MLGPCVCRGGCVCCLQRADFLMGQTDKKTDRHSAVTRVTVEGGSSLWGCGWRTIMFSSSSSFYLPFPRGALFEIDCGPSYVCKQSLGYTNTKMHGYGPGLYSLPTRALFVPCRACLGTALFPHS